MTLRERVALFLSMLLATMGVATFSAAPAMATPAICSQAYAYCGFDRIQYRCLAGDLCERTYVFSAGDRGVAYNDTWDSFWNNSNFTVSLYKDRVNGVCSGVHITAYHNTGWEWLGNVRGAELLNSVSCVRTHG